MRLTKKLGLTSHVLSIVGALALGAQVFAFGREDLSQRDAASHEAPGGLFTIAADPEKAIRKGPGGGGSALLHTVIGAPGK